MDQPSVLLADAPFKVLKDTSQRTYQHNLTNQFEVRDNHSTWSEQSLQILWQLSTSSVTWVHCDENTDCWDQVDFFSKEVEPVKQ